MPNPIDQPSKNQTANQQSAAVYAAIKKAGDLGATRDAIAEATGIPQHSITWRVRELLRRRSVSETRQLRETRYGRLARVLVASTEVSQ
jgi:hypothetical protein